jgi:hypothetical protein
LHIFARGAHGFGRVRQGLPSHPTAGSIFWRLANGQRLRLGASDQGDPARTGPPGSRGPGYLPISLETAFSCLFSACCSALVMWPPL